MLSKSNIRDILRDTLLFIRKLSQNPENIKNLEQIRELADIAHNIPTLLYEWDILETKDPQKLELFTDTLENEIRDYALKYPESPYHLIKNITQ